jgi:hypothetical protein
MTGAGLADFSLPVRTPPSSGQSLGPHPAARFGYRKQSHNPRTEYTTNLNSPAASLSGQPGETETPNKPGSSARVRRDALRLVGGGRNCT